MEGIPMKSEELKPCPFCGEDGKYIDLIRRKGGNWDIGCNDALCFGWCCHDRECDCEDGYVKKEDAIKAWNTRKGVDEDEIEKILWGCSESVNVMKTKKSSIEIDPLKTAHELSKRIGQNENR